MKDPILEYLDAMIQIKGEHSKGFHSMESFVKKFGSPFTSQKYPEKYIKSRGEKKLCFSNAFQLSQLHPELTYAEGFGWSEGIPIAIHHAFCVDEEGRVVDPTWDNQETTQYFGVKFNRKYVFDTVFRTEHYGILDNYHEGYPLYRGVEGHEEKNFGFVVEV